jgi:hypothetical protein
MQCFFADPQASRPSRSPTFCPVFSPDALMILIHLEPKVLSSALTLPDVILSVLCLPC